MLRFRLEKPLSQAESSTCCAEAMDVFRDHRLCCSALGVHARHHELRNEFAFLCMELDLRVEFEQGPPRSLIRRANVLLSSFGALIVVDFSVVHALQPSIALVDVQPGKAT